MSDESIWHAIESRDMRELTRIMHPSYENARAMTQQEMEAKQFADAALMRVETDEEMAARYGDGLRNRVPQYTKAAADLRARLSLERRDEPKEGGANTWQDRDADEYGVPRTGPI